MRMRIDRAKIAAAMARADLTVQLLADRSGLSRVTITAVRSGKSCSQETARKLVAILGPDILVPETNCTPQAAAPDASDGKRGMGRDK